MNRTCILLLVLFTANSSFSQNYSWVYFHPDSTTTVDAQTKTLYPLHIEVIGTSKWLNAACVKGLPKQALTLGNVDKVVPLGRYKVTNHQTTQTMEDFKPGKSDWQLNMLGLDTFHKRGFTGKGVTIALFDAGFYRVDSLQAFDSLRKRNQIKAVWDFHTNDTNVYIQDGHGMYVLSIAGGYWADSIMGAAPDADFLLARTEVTGREIHLEEYAWIKALEWADSIGVDIIHSSLGYSVFDSLEGDYEYADMDGRTTVITLGTDIAASKGIFVTNSAGNEGTNSWRKITAPCDGRFVLCVGAVDSNRVHAAFSSYGPSADGRIKPDVVAMGKGVTYVDKEGRIRTGSGTSFSGPLIAGFVACLKQAWPGATNDHLYKAIIQSADKYNNPDTAYGFGLPNVLLADSILAIFSSASTPIAESIQIFPNPGSGLIKINGAGNIQRVTLFDAMGRVVLINHSLSQQNLESTDVSTLPDGSYWIHVLMADGAVFRRLFFKIEG